MLGATETPLMSGQAHPHTPLLFFGESDNRVVSGVIAPCAAEISAFETSIRQTESRAKAFIICCAVRFSVFLGRCARQTLRSRSGTVGVGVGVTSSTQAHLHVPDITANDPQLMPDDPEATSPKGDYAFDNPAFKTENGGHHSAGGPAVTGNVGGGGGAGTANSNSSKTGSPLDPSWTSKQNTIEKRKTVDDSYVNVTTPRLVSLRGSDFTGLGVEVYGGLKEGIFVRKVMPQGPAAGLVNTGDRITSITIDFRHIVQEDAMTILSYASPYNVQLELVGGTKPVLGPQTQSPKPGHQSLTHPLYRSSSQSDLNTIERNSRKKLFPAEDSPLKMDNRAASPSSMAKAPATVHKEHEREPKKHSFKQQMREMIEETFQTKHAPATDGERTKGSVAGEETSTQKKGHKFGIRVFPPSVNDKLFGKSPTKVQADNENNTNIERKESG
ncbi:hypothetical protein AND_008408 [Anopheles darlingi]|uniref:PDZ domain-containing protein n=1 Tax=Anopheles darlingi TaxID=43151 RepID=W5JB44_ANODA|nr:hypothetical protein AND_008408 [Anopheles darlingi]